MGLFFVIKSDSDKQPELKCISDKMCHKKAFKNKEIIMMNYMYPDVFICYPAIFILITEYKFNNNK